MSDEKKREDHPETNFLPPLKMYLAFLDEETRQKRKAKKQEDSDEKKIEKLIEKLNEKDEDSGALSSSKGKK